MQSVPQREAHAEALDGGQVRRHVAQEQRARGHRGEVERAQRARGRRHARQVLARHVRVVADERERVPAVVAFAVAASGVSAFGIGSPFWALMAGGVLLALDRWR